MKDLQKQLLDTFNRELVEKFKLSSLWPSITWCERSVILHTLSAMEHFFFKMIPNPKSIVVSGKIPVDFNWRRSRSLIPRMHLPLEVSSVVSIPGALFHDLVLHPRHCEGLLPLSWYQRLPAWIIPGSPLSTDCSVLLPQWLIGKPRPTFYSEFQFSASLISS